MKYWYIYCAGGYGAETMDLLNQAHLADHIDGLQPAFLDDRPKKPKMNGYPVIAFDDAEPSSRVTIAVGEPETRYELRLKANEASLRLSSIISPLAFISPTAQIGNGAIIGPFCSIQARAIIGENVAVNTSAIVGHDVVIDVDTVISSMVNLGGAVEVGSRCYIGMGAMLKEQIAIGQSTIVGMGSVVYNDMPKEVICIGNPARVSRRNTSKRVFK